MTRLPPEIGQLSALKILFLHDNKITSLPPEIGQLSKLSELHLYGNQLISLPPEIGQLSALLRLVLRRNQLTRLPPQIGQLSALQELYVHSNQLTRLPPEIGQLSSLKVLALSGNRLTSLPPEIGQLSSLMRFHLSDNRLTSLPPEIVQLSALQELYLHSNPGLELPPSLLGPIYDEVHNSVEKQRKLPANPADILNFYFSRLSAKQAGRQAEVGEIKVMLVGRGGAGKTSLRRYFMNQPHDKGEKETPGIALEDFELQCGEKTVLAHLWDFAGQEITHALHQFFLSEGCVYVLVLDPRSNTEMQDAQYWLALLERYAPGAPVLVALNRQDARGEEGYDVDRVMLRERFPQIQGFIPTNCETRAGCADLRAALCGVIENLPATQPPHLVVDSAWLRVKEECFKERQGRNRKPRPCLPLEEFRRICERHGEKDPARQESLARVLHKLGAVLHFVDEPRLRDTAVLDPHWVTDGVYRLLRCKEGPQSDGIVSLADALKALPDRSEEDARWLMRVMERFDMCFPLDADGEATRWLVPGALRAFQPENVGQEWQREGAVRMRYVYDPLPEGVLPRFIVLTHLLSEEQPRWRHGVVLRDWAAAALVRRSTRPNMVEVTAYGPKAERLRLLEIIQANLERINAEVPDPKPYAELELEGMTGVYRRVDDLEAAEHGRQQVAVSLPGANALVEPTPQLNRTSEHAARLSSLKPLSLFLSYSHKDKRAKNHFQDNLAVMNKKKLVLPWQDGLIEPGTRWLDEITENLYKMDVFVGLLTNAFVLSDFIENVEIKAAREKLAKKGRDFLFVLILVDDIPLTGLDLAQYQILKPGGKAVSQHPSMKKGFLEAQRELEPLIRARQKEKPKRHVADFKLRASQQEQEERAKAEGVIYFPTD